MKLMRPPFACTLCAALFAGSVGSALAQARSGLDTELFDPSVRAQDDLFRHVNGTWLKTVPIPADKARYGAFDQIADQTQEQLRTLVEAKVEQGDALDTAATFGDTEEREGAEVVDLMEALQRSVERNKAKRESKPARARKRA